MSGQGSRNDKGLLDGVSYCYRQDGLIDWRAMLDSKHLVPNKDSFSDPADVSGQDVTQLNDSNLLVSLAGLKELAGIRGYSKVDYEVISTAKEYVAVKCTVEWIANYETGMQPVQFSGLADAHVSNTSGYGRKFLTAICENRAFARAVRNFLQVNVVCQDELDPNEDEIVFEVI